MELHSVADARYTTSESVACRVIAGETLVVPIRRGVGDLANIYTFNAVGDYIWSQLSAGPKDEGDLVRGLSEIYEIDEDQARQDLVGFLAELQAEGLVAVASNAAVAELGPNR